MAGSLPLPSLLVRALKIAEIDDSQYDHSTSRRVQELIDLRWQTCEQMAEQNPARFQPS
jgi:hypothetical protein